MYYQGPIDIKGPDAQTLLDHVLARDVPRRLATDGQVLYASMCNEAGGMIDDLTAYRLGSEHYWLIATPAGRKPWNGTSPNSPAIVVPTSRTASRGPPTSPCRDRTHVRSSSRSRPRISRTTHLPYFRFVQTTVADVPTLLSRTGYSGELGYELYYPRDYALHMWDTLIAAGATPCGLGALRSTRMEKKYPLYGLDVSETTSPARSGSGLGRRPGRRVVHRPRRAPAPA